MEDRAENAHALQPVCRGSQRGNPQLDAADRGRDLAQFRAYCMAPAMRPRTSRTPDPIIATPVSRSDRSAPRRHAIDQPLEERRVFTLDPFASTLLLLELIPLFVARDIGLQITTRRRQRHIWPADGLAVADPQMTPPLTLSPRKGPVTG